LKVQICKWNWSCANFNPICKNYK